MTAMPAGKSGYRKAPLHRRRMVVLLAVAIAVVFGARPASAEGFWSGVSRSLAITYDVVILRPLNAVALAVGSVFFVASVPLVAPFEGVRPSWETFVYAPYEYTFKRDLGDF